MDSQRGQASPQQPHIKKFMVRMHKRMTALQEVLHATKQDYTDIRAGTQVCENTNKEHCNDLTNKTLDDLERLETDFKKMVSEEKKEVSFLKQQLASLTQDKMKLQQSTLLLETRVASVEGHVGIEITLPQVEDDSDDEVQ